MARYTGPRRRIVRRLGAVLHGLTRHTPEERPAPPGQHGVRRRRRRESAFALQLREKQKLRYYFGLSETQLRNYVARAERLPGRPGENLLRLLELRLDNAVFRLGLAPTIPAARQLVRHGHVRVDGQRASVPSLALSPGRTIAVAERSRSHPRILEAAARGPELAVPPWLRRAADGLSGEVVALPSRGDTPIDVAETMVIELYAR